MKNKWKRNRKRIAGFLAAALLMGQMGMNVRAEAGVKAQLEAEYISCADYAEGPEEITGFEEAESVQDPELYEKPEVLVVFESGKEAEAAVRNQSISGKNGEIKKVLDETVLFSVKNKKELEDALKAFSRENKILYFQPNYTVTVNQIPNDPYFTEQWGLLNNGTFMPKTQEYSSYTSYEAYKDVDMNVPEAWDVLNAKQEQTGVKKQVVVALIDTGVDIEHEDLKNNIWTNEDEVLDGIDNDGNGYIDDIHGWNVYAGRNQVFESAKEDDHGTHVAGIVGAVQQNGIGIAGVASAADVKIMPVKCLGGKDGNGSLVQILEGITYAEKNGADIVNMSFGFEGNPDSDMNLLFADKMRRSKLLFIAAVGNGDERTGIGFDVTNRQLYPACCDASNLITVGNLLWNGKLDKSSNYSAAYVDVAAPGMAIYSTLPANQYGYMSGTSMSAPMVTGVAALVMAYYDRVTAEDVRKIINTTVKTDSALYGYTITGGIPDAYSALTSQDAALIARKTPPDIQLSEAYESADSYRKRLNISVTDEQNDIVIVCGDYGVRDAAYFEGGQKGQLFSEDPAGTTGSILFDIDTTYTVYARDRSGYETTKSYDLKIKQVQLESSAETLKVGQKYKLNPTLNTEEAGNFTYQSSKEKVASVTKKGVVKAKKKGWTKITVSTPNGKDTEIYITVKKKKK